MKKSFKTKVEGKNSDRLIESIKHEIRQYIKREKRKPVPEGMDFWDFDCRFGKNSTSAEAIKASQITSYIDTATKDDYEEFYIEILAKAVSKIKL